MNGWIKLHRQLLENPVFKNHKLLQTFLYCLLKASHSDHEQLVGDSIVPIKSGQLVTGRKAISNATGLSEQSVRTALNKLEKLGILTSKPTNKYSIISITNWDLYQQTNQQVTSNQPASNQQVTTNKNVKNVKNVKNENNTRFVAPSRDDIAKYFTEKGSTTQEADKFFYFYDSKNWMVGKNKMKKWKSAASSWIARNLSSGGFQNKPSGGIDNRDDVFL